MTSTTRSAAHGPAPVQRDPSRSDRGATRSRLLAAARLGAAVAEADLAGRPEDAAGAFASWRRLRRGTGRQSRQLLRIAFDTGYGQARSTPR